MALCNVMVFSPEILWLRVMELCVVDVEVVASFLCLHHSFEVHSFWARSVDCGAGSAL
jgi:hypothetical protein